ncbi:uncharacterized protein HMPREF1541_02907 [Cyphellophora europaea CBS 101466]|uniref:Transcription factor domain-containing protein n=1 Tax=Cyphellophora europaea (strain CBS 101466) TaxID=1220924 RepID=W2S6S7_CYPE1|nr:uncharacterized protein HMPREF1541_02907 [Cyphellophora europaea CBS 101466]ETN43748.1 hypothetical protein HMPREF1541_02907 [Cyphellophora europaea CBS 101466]
MIVLPNCHPSFYHGWINEIRQLMTVHKSLYYSVLACSASQLRSLSGTQQMHGLALEYYSRGIETVSSLLAVESAATHNGLLMTIILLYLHGCLGLTTFSDIPRHVEAAIQLLRLRFFTGHDGAIRRPFDRIAIESVLYQVFLTAMGSWCQRIEQDFHFDAEFWLQAEKLLAQSTLFPSEPATVNSPVLGVPMSLFRLVLSIKQIYQGPNRQDQETINHLRDELDEWEAMVLRNDDLDLAASRSELSHYEIYKDAAFLYILAASLLLDQADEFLFDGTEILEPRPSSSWQVAKMIQILQDHAEDYEWAKCFIGNWPLYTIGFFMETQDEIELVRADLQRRWDISGFSQVARFRGELETAWAGRAAPAESAIVGL